jgi:hypothetical protein
MEPKKGPLEGQETHDEKTPIRKPPAGNTGTKTEGEHAEDRWGSQEGEVSRRSGTWKAGSGNAKEPRERYPWWPSSQEEGGVVCPRRGRGAEAEGNASLRAERTSKI